MPPSYSALKVPELATAEQFTLWAIRSWVEAYKASMPICDRLAKGFDLAGMPEGLPTLDEMLSVVAASACVQIDVRCVRCRTIGDGECVMLKILVAAQAGRLTSVRDGFASWLPPAAVRVAADAARRFAAVLWSAGMVLPPREALPVGPPVMAASHYPDPGLRRRQ